MNGLSVLALLALPIGAIASASSQDPATIEQAAAETVLVQLGQLDQRLSVPVAIGNSKPYNFVIDTGAERTVVSRQLASVLGLAPSGRIQVTSMTERSLVDTVIVPELFIRSIGQRHTIRAPALEASNIGAPGLLGIDTLQKHRVVIDFERNEMAVMPSQPRRRATPTDPDEIVVVARSKFGQLIVTDAYYGNMPIKVVLDTGSQVSVGNSALRKRVRARKGQVQITEITSVTGGKANVDYMMVPDIKLGNIRFGAMPVAFTDAAPFTYFGLANKPAMLLGMDSLREFRRVEIDFPNRQVRFLLPKGAERRARDSFGSMAALSTLSRRT